MPPVTTDWDRDEPRLVRVRLGAPVRWDVIEDYLNAQRWQGYPEHWVMAVDLREAGSLPQLSVAHMARLLNILPAGALGFAVITSSSQWRAMIPLLARLYPSLEARFHVTDDDDDARAWLLRQLLSMPEAQPS